MKISAELQQTDRDTDRSTDRKISPAEHENFYLTIATPGLLETLQVQPAPRQQPAYGEVEIEVAAAGLNFKEVLLALGLIPVAADLSYKFGLECAGKITALGKGVRDFAIGDEVIAFGTACFSRFITTTTRLVAPKPAHLSLEEAATVPIAFATAYYALITVGKLDRGEKVLIHSAAGGVGMAAVEIAQSVGAEIFATASNPEKHELLHSRGIQYVMDSRSLTFAEDVMRYTNGEGVDVVLNSLSGEFIPKSLSVLGRYGRFLEIGQRDILNNSSLGLRAFEQRLSFFAIQVEPDAPHFDTMWQAVIQQFQNQRFRPLPYRVFPLAEVADAFAYLTEAKHIGKVVISLHEPVNLSLAPSLPGTANFRASPVSSSNSSLAQKELPASVQSAPIGAGSAQPTTPPIGFAEDFFKQGLRPSEGIKAFRRILGSKLPQVLVSTRDLAHRIDLYSADRDPARHNTADRNSLNGTNQQYFSEQTNRSQPTHPRPALPHEYVPPRTELEQTIANIWQTFLGIAQVGIHDSFFELGGHSLMATQVIAKMSLAVNMNLSLDILFDQPTIAKVTQHIEQVRCTAQTLQTPVTTDLNDRAEIEL